MKRKTLFLSIFAGILTAFAVSMITFSRGCSDIRSDILRLHVIANSDSAEDQELKIKVRDAVLKEGKDIFDGSMDIQRAQSEIIREKGRLVKAAEKTVRENGFDYPVDILVTKEFFPTRSYGNLTVPAGKYEAVKVTIGESAGHNWWCVMFPPLCLPAAGEKDADIYFDENERQIIRQDPQYDFRFKIVEWYEELKEKYF